MRHYCFGNSSEVRFGNRDRGMSTRLIRIYQLNIFPLSGPYSYPWIHRKRMLAPPLGQWSRLLWSRRISMELYRLRRESLLLSDSLLLRYFLIRHQEASDPIHCPDGWHCITSRFGSSYEEVALNLVVARSYECFFPQVQSELSITLLTKFIDFKSSVDHVLCRYSQGNTEQGR